MTTEQDLTQVERLKKLIGTDEAFFLLAIVSYIEGYCKNSLYIDDYPGSFKQLLEEFRKDFKDICTYDQIKACKEINQLHFKTNQVRHRFDFMDKEEAWAGITSLKKFAKEFNLPNSKAINELWDGSEWKQRETSENNVKYLLRALEENRKLKLENEDFANKLKKYTETQALLDETLAKIKSLELQIKNAKNAKDENLKNQLEESNKEKQELLKQLDGLKAEKTYTENVQRIIQYTRTRYDFERTMLTLTEQQESIVNQVDFKNVFLIRGSAGTGKSLVLIKIIEKLKNQNLLKDNNMRLLTFGKSLSKYNIYLSSLLNITLEPENTVLTADSFTNNILKTAFKQNVNYKESKYENLIETINLKDSPLDFTQLKKELHEFIFPNVITKEQYCVEMVKRTGMQKGLDEDQRKKVWEKVEEFINLLEKEKTTFYSYVYYKFALALRNKQIEIPEEQKVDYIIIDEVQDLTAAKLSIIKECSRNALLLAGDSDQTIVLPGFSWKYANISVKGRTRNLHTNFRNTDQLNKLAEAYRKKIPGMDIENKPKTFRLGPDPELYTVTGKVDAFEKILEAANYCINTLGYEPENICIVTNNKIYGETAIQNELIPQIKEKIGENISLQDISSKDFDFSKKGAIRYSTLHHIKGLDFPVILYYLDNEYYNAKAYDEDTCDKMNRNVIYTAITRSIDFLQIYVNHNITIKAVTDFIDTFNEIFNSNDSKKDE